MNAITKPENNTLLEKLPKIRQRKTMRRVLKAPAWGFGERQPLNFRKIIRANMRYSNNRIASLPVSPNYSVVKLTIKSSHYSVKRWKNTSSPNQPLFYQEDYSIDPEDQDAS